MRRQVRRVFGYYDLGPVQIPPFPTRIILTDREDGTLWVLSHDEEREHVMITDTFPTDRHYTIYGPWDGPTLGTHPRVQLLIRNGQLGYEQDDNPVWLRDRDQARILSRRGRTTTYTEIVVPEGWAYPDALAFEDDP